MCKKKFEIEILKHFYIKKL